MGCTLALALRASGLRVALLDPHSSPGHFQPIALSHASRLILERVGVWRGLATTAIEHIVVTQAGAFGRTRLDAAEADVPALGYVTQYASLVAALRAPLADLMVSEEVSARCVAHAEGASADAVEKSYGQSAVVALVETAPAAASTAFERFTAEGPLALLPLEGRYALIWTTSPQRADALVAADEKDFLRALGDAAGSGAGRPIAVAQRNARALVRRVRATRIAPRAVYIGNAAQTLHPVAGQGLNLGLRDAWQLARELAQASDPGAAHVLERYAARRRLDAGATIAVTHWLAAGFTGSNRALRAARGLGLGALDLLPGARRFFARRMIYGPSAAP
ncbi:MAG TPA: FAD-dependent monooxygenase [Burkholderiales bacterium]|nr:FAD-dependent monooxygenase [Burkholderiales bacterium]